MITDIVVVVVIDVTIMLLPGSPRTKTTKKRPVELITNNNN